MLTLTERLELARASRGKTEKQRPAVRDDFLDMDEWERLASDAGVRLPHRGQEATTGRLTPFLKKIGVSIPAFTEWMGCKTFKEALSLNPDWSARAVCGLALEYRERCAEVARREIE